MQRKPKKCKTCKRPFLPWSSLQVVCGNVACALAHAGDKKVKEEKKKITQARKKLRDNDVGHWKKKAQAEFNKFIRLRDTGGCISCEKAANKYDAGHYRSVGSNPALRFEEDNCHKQCVFCNQYNSGNAIDYRINLIKKIGEDRVKWLEGPHELQKLACEDLKAIELKYKKKLKELEQCQK